MSTRHEIGFRVARHIAVPAITITLGWCGVAGAGAGWQPSPGANAQSAAEQSMDGRFLFDSYCAPCHGANGKGDGTVALALKAVPPDLSRLTVRHGGAFPRALVERFVTDGKGDLAPLHASKAMPLWGPNFRSFDPSDAHARERIANIVGYIETLQSEAQIVSGPLVHHGGADELFRIGSLWMQVRPDTLFHRWLVSGAGKRATITLTTDPSRFDDKRNTRVLTGTLFHSTAPAKMPIVHVLLLKDEELGAFGPVTLQTDDQSLAAKFDPHDGAVVSVVLAIKQ